MADEKTGFDISTVPMPAKALKQRLSTFIGHHGGDFSEWYFGLTADPEMSLFEVHGVHPRRGLYRHFRATEPYIARKVKRYYIQRGMHNGQKAARDLCGVYIYKITENTVQ
jgi:hypothetical protein